LHEETDSNFKKKIIKIFELTKTSAPAKLPSPNHHPRDVIIYPERQYKREREKKKDRYGTVDDLRCSGFHDAEGVDITARWTGNHVNFYYAKVAEKGESDPRFEFETPWVAPTLGTNYYRQVWGSLAGFLASYAHVEEIEE
jgi:hypothetical protein